MFIHLERANSYISTSHFSYIGNVGHHNHSLMGRNVLVDDPRGLVHASLILGWAPTLIPYVTTRSKWYDIVFPKPYII
jgi:hypothetical protein